MVSRRTWFVISMMMAVLFFLFVFSGVMKERLNKYDTNSYAQESEITKSQVWKAEKNNVSEVVLLGSNKNSGIYNTVSQWCLFTKKGLAVYEDIEDYKFSQDKRPKFILIDSEGIDFSRYTGTINSWVEAGMNVVFCNLPKPAVIAENYQLSQLLGIQAVYLESVPIEGVKLFEGFLFGGDTIYKAENEEEEKLQDFQMDIPWYQTTSGTKTYVVGMMDEDEVINEYMPGIVWRHSIGEAKVFVVNGDYISKNVGIGFLSGFENESSQYSLYPVVNAQNLTIANFPSFSTENNLKMMEVYSRTQPAMFKELVWPNLLATVQKNKNKMTCLISLQQDYEDSNEPLPSEYEYYFRIINEAGAEAGISVERRSELSVADKLRQDGWYFANLGNKYRFSAYYADKKDIAAAVKLAGKNEAQDMHTIATKYDDGGKILSYAGEDVTLQMATIDGFSHTYQEDMRVKSLETALGYSNILLDMTRIAWPESKADYFEKLSEDFARYTNTYWQSFEMFQQTTLSESDRRVRNFLALDYSHSRNNNRIKLDIKNTSGTSWFVLRTHDEEIESIDGATYVEIEKDAYLIEVKDAHIEVVLKETHGENFFYVN